MMRCLRREKGFSIQELVIVLAVSAVLASAFVSLAGPQIQLYFFMPQRLKMQNAAFDLLEIMVNGDSKARGMRFAGPIIPTEPTLGNFTPPPAVVEAFPDSFGFTYVNFDRMDPLVKPMRVTFRFTPHRVTRRIDVGTINLMGGVTWINGTEQPTPYYVTASSNVKIRTLENNTSGLQAFFRYYNSSGTEFTPSPSQYGDIRRVDIPMQSGSQTTDSLDAFRLKTGVWIRDYRETLIEEPPLQAS